MARPKREVPDKKARKRLKPLKADNPLRYKTKSGKLLTEKETLFVRLYTETMTDRIASAIEAYDIDMNKPNWRITASAIATENLSKPTILEAIREILDAGELNDEVIDNELAWVAKQRRELNPKMKAVNEYNKMKGRLKQDDVSLIIKSDELRQIGEALRGLAGAKTTEQSGNDTKLR